MIAAIPTGQGESEDPEVHFVAEFDELEPALEWSRGERGWYDRVWMEASGTDEALWGQDPIWDWEVSSRGGRGSVTDRVRTLYRVVADDHLDDLLTEGLVGKEELDDVRRIYFWDNILSARRYVTMLHEDIPEQGFAILRVKIPEETPSVPADAFGIPGGHAMELDRVPPGNVVIAEHRRPPKRKRRPEPSFTSHAEYEAWRAKNVRARISTDADAPFRQTAVTGSAVRPRIARRIKRHRGPGRGWHRQPRRHGRAARKGWARRRRRS